MGLEDVKVSLICHQRLEDIPRGYRQRMVGHYKVSNTTDPGQLAVAVKALANAHGFPHRFDQLHGRAARSSGQGPGLLQDPGHGLHGNTRNFRDKARMKTVLRNNGFPCAKHCLSPLQRKRPSPLRIRWACP